MCFHPHSDLSLPLMSQEEIVSVIEAWAKEQKELGEMYTWVQVSEKEPV